jgi:hypothetical protein
VSPQAIIEIGSCRGSTAELFSHTELPIFGIESNPRYYEFSRARFHRRRNIKMLLGDGRIGLRKLFDRHLCPLAGGTLFFYLDAHWNDDLSLAEEIDIVFSKCPSAVVMIDDFGVPFDAAWIRRLWTGKSSGSRLHRIGIVCASPASLLSLHPFRCRLSFHFDGRCRLCQAGHPTPGLPRARQRTLSRRGLSLDPASSSRAASLGSGQHA